MLAPTIAQIAEENEGVIKVGKVNVDDEGDLAQKYGIVSIPTVILFKNGEEVKKSTGFVPKEALEAMFK
jgi:thioredoxin 1